MKKPAKKRKPKSRRPAKGADLLNQVCQMTGIPGGSIGRELKAILDRKNIDLNNLTLEQLRGVAATYLREIMGSLLDKAKPSKPEPSH